MVLGVGLFSCFVFSVLEGMQFEQDSMSPRDHFSDYMQMWLLGKESHQLQKNLATSQSICMQVSSSLLKKVMGKCYVVCYTLRKNAGR